MCRKGLLYVQRPETSNGKVRRPSGQIGERVQEIAVTPNMTLACKQLRATLWSLKPSSGQRSPAPIEAPNAPPKAAPFTTLAAHGLSRAPMNVTADCNKMDHWLDSCCAKIAVFATNCELSGLPSGIALVQLA